MKEYPETHLQGTISIENIPEELYHEYLRGNYNPKQLQGDFAIQVAANGRVWVCINGIAFIRFSPHPNGKMQKEDTQ